MKITTKQITNPFNLNIHKNASVEFVRVRLDRPHGSIDYSSEFYIHTSTRDIYTFQLFGIAYKSKIPLEITDPLGRPMVYKRRQYFSLRFLKKIMREGNLNGYLVDIYLPHIYEKACVVEANLDSIIKLAFLK